MPKIGSFRSASPLRMFWTAASQVSGSPGPLEMKQSVELQSVEIIIPRNADYFHIRFSRQRMMLVLTPQSTRTTFFLKIEELGAPVFHVADNFCSSPYPIVYTLAYTDAGNFPSGSSSNHDPPVPSNHSPHHRHVHELCQLTGIDARNARHLLTFQPVTETFHGIPMTVVFGIIAYDNRLRHGCVHFP